MYLNTPKIGELVIVGPPGSAKQAFLSAFCSEVSIADQDILIGRFPVNNDLVVYCYGISHDLTAPVLAWDLVANKMIGYIVLFDWNNVISFQEALKIIDFTSDRFSSPFIIAADLRDMDAPVPEAACKPYVLLSNLSRFMFCRSTKSSNVKKVVISLLDILLEKIE